MNKIFIPKKIRIGYQERKDTYTGKLAYVIYYDEKGKIRKEPSWNNWRNDSIEADEYENLPTEGFVLNKKVGDYSGDWGNHRQAYSRVYDPRGFEFEITIENLLYILENTSSIKGKGLEGEFVYGWDGGDLLLIPTSSPDYVRLTEYSDKRNNPDKINKKNIVLGATYKNKNDENLIYLGYFDYYDYYSWREDKKIVKRFCFAKFENGKVTEWKHYSSLSSMIEFVDSKPHSEYPEIMEALEHQTFYSPLDPSKYEYEVLTAEELIKHNGDYYNYWNNKLQAIVALDGTLYDCEIEVNTRDYSSKTLREFTSCKMYPVENYYGVSNRLPSQYTSGWTTSWTTLGDLMSKYKFVRVTKKYLANGKSA